MSATERAAACLQRVVECLAGLEHRVLAARDGLPTIAVERGLLRQVLVCLAERGGFEQATFVTAVDRFPAEPRFELVHQLLSYATNDRLRVKTALPGTDASAPSCIDLWPGAAYMERECFDMFGIRFEGHAGLKRLLMPEGYDHHPLRKDFPHHGIEPDRLYREWDAQRRSAWTPEP